MILTAPSARIETVPVGLPVVASGRGGVPEEVDHAAAGECDRAGRVPVPEVDGAADMLHEDTTL